MSRKIDYRSRNTREETPVVFVMGDGRSEKTYFDHLNKLVKRTRIKAYDLGESGWKVILKNCDGRVRTSDIDPKHDLIAIVTDEDGRYDEESIRKFQEECGNKGYRLYLSNISFEVWLLMHYEPLTVSRTQEELEERLREFLGGGYSKSKGIEFDIAMVEHAVKNAGKNLPRGDNLSCLRKNPSTRVHFLIKEILERERRRIIRLINPDQKYHRNRKPKTIQAWLQVAQKPKIKMHAKINMTFV